MDEIRWRAPVRPGDTVRVVVTVTDRRLSKTNPNRGIVVAEWEMLNQRDEVVLGMHGPMFVSPCPATDDRGITV